MSSAIVLIVVSFILQSIRATFPPVSNAPPLPAQASRPWDISEQRVYIQDDTQSSLPQNVIKDAGYLPPDPKIDDQPWFVPENQSGEKSDFPSSTETQFLRYFDNGSPAVGPVATPLPDDTYVAQPSSASKIVPNPSGNVGSDIWVLTKGPNDQYIPERWVQVQVADDRIVDVVNQDTSPKFVSESVKTVPQQPIPIKNPALSVPPTKVQQIWIRAPSPIQSQKIVQNAAAYVQEVPAVKQVVDVPQPAVKQYVQTQILAETQPLPPPPPTLSKKTSSFVVPPPPPPPYKGVDISPPQQTVIVNGLTAASGDKSGGVTVAKNSLLAQVKHIWIPTSQQSGKFITVPVGTVVDTGKTISAKGISMDIPQPVAVSDTWILKQDGPIPRFEQQKSIDGQIIQNGNVLVAETPVLQFDSNKNPPLLDKTVDVTVSGDIWPARKGFVDPNSVGKSEIQPLVFPAPPLKSNPVVVGKTISTQPVFSQKSYISAPTVLQPPPPPPVLPPFSPNIKGKPCPVSPQKSPLSPKSIPFPAYRSIAAINRQPFARIIRLNRYPHGSYYVLNPRIGPSLYAYPRLQAPVLQRTRNGLVRLVATRQIGGPLPIRQVAIQVPKRQTALPVSATKSIAPILQPQILYPSVQAVNRLRYAYPWGYLRSLPVAGRNIFALPTFKSAKLEVLTSSSSESSSSESSSSESKSSKSKSKKPKKSEEVQDISSNDGVSAIESEEPEPTNEPEKESEVEQDVSESAPEAVETDEEAPTETETKDSIEIAESQLHPQFTNQPHDDLGKANFEILGKPSFIRFESRDRPSTILPHREMPNLPSGYGFRNSIFKNVVYVANNGGYEPRFVGNNPETIRHGSENPSLEASTPAQSTTKRPKDTIISESITTDVEMD